MRRAYTIKSGLIAILIYILMIFIAIWAFVENEKDTEPFSNGGDAIKVDMSSVDSSANSNTPKANTKNEDYIKKEQDVNKEEKEQITEEAKTVPNQVEKEIVKPKDNTPSQKLITKTQTKEITKTATNTPKVKKDATSLFDNVEAKVPLQTVKKSETTTQKQITSNSNTQVSKKASDLIGGATSTKSSGIENGYKSKVKSILNGWPAQSDFAGNKAKIKFVIEPSGRFEFDVISKSSNEEFNKGLIQYLKQLQKVGFGAHGGDRAYVFDVDFIAER